MRWSLALFIGLRYIRAKKKSGFVSFISLISMIGIALGVLVLITVLSVFNGFNHVIKAQLFSMVPHITLTSDGQQLNNWTNLVKKVQSNPDVTAVAPYVSGQSLLSADGATTPAMIYGINPSQTNRIMHLSSMMVAGKITALNNAGHFGIVLGAGLAGKLGVNVGDHVNVFTPKVSVSPFGVMPRFRQFTVVGVFQSDNGFGFDSEFAFMNLHDAAVLYGLGQGITGLHIDVKNLFLANSVADQLQSELAAPYEVDPWGEQYGAFYHTIQIQKTMMFLIMLLIIAIAAFNLVSSLVMLVNEKRADIAILRTMGMTPKMIMSIFVYQGSLVTFIGIIIGCIGGVVLSLNITAFVNFIQGLFHVQLISASVNFVNYLPSQLSFSDIWHVCLIAFLMGFLATIYPAWRASKIQVVEALRYE